MCEPWAGRGVPWVSETARCLVRLWGRELCLEVPTRTLAALPQLLRVDVSTLDPAGGRLDSAMAVCFGPAPPAHLLVSTFSNTVAVLDATSGRVVREVSPGQHPAAWSPPPPFRPGCGASSLAREGRAGRQPRVP